jgi:hypothetical protein
MSDTAIVHCNRRFTVLKRSRFFPLDCVAFEQTATLLHCRNRVETYWVLRNRAERGDCGRQHQRGIGTE